MKFTPHSLLGVLALNLSPLASASNVIWNYSTGEGTTTGQINPGASGEYRYDWANQWNGFGTATIYTIAPNYVGSWEGSQAYNYITPPGGASWTSMLSNGHLPNLGTYTFIYHFSNPSGAASGIFDMAFVSDDQVTDILLNGVSIYGGNGPLGSWLDVTTLGSIPVTLVPGTNTLSVVITNTTWSQGGQIANMALGATYQISSISPIPEPTALLPALSGALLLLRRKRRFP